MIKLAIELSIFWPPVDRFVSTGYRKAITWDKMWNSIDKIDGIDGIEPYWPGDFPKGDLSKVLNELNKRKLTISSIGVDIFTNKIYKFGSIGSLDNNVRNRAIDVVKKAIDIAHKTNTNMITLWLGQDGFDYPFQSNHEKKWEFIFGSLGRISDYNPQVKIALEYKTKEPRNYSYVSNAGKTLAICKIVNKENLGITLDVGHSIFAGENPAETLIFLLKEKKLFHLHVNDNFKVWDDDLLPGSVNFWETLEFCYWLNKYNWNEWVNFDICPYREDPTKAANIAIKNWKKLMDISKNLSMDKINNFQDKDDSMGVSEYLWKEIFK